MNRSIIAPVALIGGLVLPVGVAQDDRTAQSKPVVSARVHYFLTSEAYLQMPPELQKVYTIGVVDGMTGSPFAASSSSPSTARASAAGREWLSACLEDEKMTGSQVAEIVRKYVQEHPEHWQWPAGVMALDAMREACPSASSSEPHKPG